LRPASHGDRGNITGAAWAEDEWKKFGAVLVRPDALHEVDARDTTVLIGFVDSESELGAALCDRIDGDILYVTESQVARWRAALRPRLDEARVDRWVGKELLGKS